MAKSNTKNIQNSQRKQKPALSPESRENQLISLAVDLAEKQLREGTASSQVISHYLKRSSMKEKLELEIMEEQKKLFQAKTEAIQSQKHIEELYLNALNAMKTYSGNYNGDENENEFE